MLGMGVGKGRGIHEEDGNEAVRGGEGLETDTSRRARKRGLGIASHDKERWDIREFQTPCRGRGG